LVWGDVKSVTDLSPVAQTTSQGKGGAVASTSLFIGASLSNPLLQGLSMLPGLRLGGRQAFGAWGVRLALGYADAEGALPSTVHYRLQSLTAELALLRRLVDAVVWLDAGVEGGGAVHFEALESGQKSTAASATVNLTATLGVRLGMLRPQLQAAAGGRLFQLNNAMVVRPVVSGALLVGVDF
jgi:hypothetical protein